MITITHRDGTRTVRFLGWNCNSLGMPSSMDPDWVSAEIKDAECTYTLSRVTVSPCRGLTNYTNWLGIGSGFVSTPADRTAWEL